MVHSIRCGRYRLWGVIAVALFSLSCAAQSSMPHEEGNILVMTQKKDLDDVLSKGQGVCVVVFSANG